MARGLPDLRPWLVGWHTTARLRGPNKKRCVLQRAVSLTKTGRVLVNVTHTKWVDLSEASPFLCFLYVQCGPWLFTYLCPRPSWQCYFCRDVNYEWVTDGSHQTAEARS